ncbi:HTH-like domain-containing protein [Robertmurraya kyonggiensis]|uniref:HTH-like domain-containing protein n=1 Tax=Robertmurraya kyonggiensis TaxID=1037680 RepID=A0A4U1DAE8_9BACI|nr:hypothetical protein [Robertmurraya kyonggiensis]TKC19128.1 hypothetical protein FA727_06170 [Robertmurraya kyonggiensis]
MNEKDLGQELRRMYHNAPTGYQVANIHLFGIKYASVIQRNNFNVKNIVAEADISLSYSTEVSKGIKLSRYVIPNED